MPSPHFSIAIAFLNPGPYFAPALQSVFAQSFSDWELILVDDGSTDGSLDLAHQLRDPRVTVVADGIRKGLAPRLNETVRLARGRYYVRMDADDIMHPNRLARLFQLFNQFDQCDRNFLIGSAAYSIDGNARLSGWRPIPRAKYCSIPDSPAPTVLGFSARHRFIHPTVAGPVEWFRDNPYTEDLRFHRSEDAELWCRTAGSTRHYYCTEPLLFYREVALFSFPNYAGTSLGVICLAELYGGQSRLARIAVLTREWCKIWITGCCHLLGFSSWIINHRFQSLPDDLRPEAETALKSVLAQPLPFHHRRPHIKGALAHNAQSD